jgi:23S rRNA (guanosine2251-2'-O)-methyltransferase
MSEEMILGVHAIQSLLTHEPHRILRLWIADNSTRIQPILALAAEHSIPIERVKKEKIEVIIDSAKASQGIVAWVRPKAPWDERALYDAVEEWMAQDKKVLLLVLDNVQDPHNLGACFRSADAFGVDAVIVPRSNSAKLTPVVRKVASGAADTLPFVIVGNLGRTLEILKDLGIWTVGLAGEADGPLHKAALKRPCALVLGAEGDGMRSRTRQLCDELASIPLVGTVDSLNVSVATGVALYEVACQRR